ncbi:MAG: DUF4230 domain-containing protein [Muribaculaceae bacterium]|nr:DUF4230 domain-containing protein [Muribaculaceae bacterium]
MLWFIAFCACHEKEEQMQVYSELKDVHQLVLAEMTLNKVGTIDDMTWDKAKGFSQHMGAFVNKFKTGKRIGVYSYNTYLQAYVDLGELRTGDVEVDEENKFVKITLPTIHTRYIGRDLGIKEEHLRVTGLRSSITPQERAEVKEVMNRTLKAEVQGNTEFSRRLEMEAKNKAREFFTLLLKNRGYESEITFK